jgi:hypothetical protein
MTKFKAQAEAAKKPNQPLRLIIRPKKISSPKSVTISPMPTTYHIEDLQSRYAELKKRIELVRSYL